MLGMLQELETRVRELYALADQAVTRFRSLSGLCCPSECTVCCNSEKVEATTLELLPLAFHLCRTGQAELLIKRIEHEPDQQRCILFRPDLVQPGGGGCSNYPHRALVCRLFGFAGTSDREGRPRLAHCRVMPPLALIPAKETQAKQTKAVMPLFNDFGLAITVLHPGFGTTRKPINHAILEALLKVGLFLELSGPGTNPASCDLPPEKPLGPSLLPRRAA